MVPTAPSGSENASGPSSHFPQVSRPRFTRLHVWIGLTLLCGSLIGCGGEKSGEAGVSDSAPTTSSSADAGSSETANSETVPSPATNEGGLQLPDAPVPAGEATPGKTGPAEAGTGGIEMPDVAPGALDQSSNGTQDSGSDALIQYASWEEIKQFAKSTGKVTVVDMWSLACEPCLNEFPGLVELHKSFGDQVHCISVDVDYTGRKNDPPENYAPHVTAFLKAVGADFDNYICNTPSDDVFAAADVVSIPAVLVFDASGNVVKRFVDGGKDAGFTYAKDITPLVRQLMN
ncbi:TlpA family protein disulfide reductase [Stieleria varia]|uniref:Thiol-disulfide oxidoreductase n=1 Tax=Stieleria varia TaxID=2528005 RepID=A0A5C6AQ22_9BACT|nr:TlpA disulfide reductase family protein [Stieleria varia]TWU01176.1 thiol-disulfide oxidoreductase [Stieleria varia]